jgi:hypothetical protein
MSKPRVFIGSSVEGLAVAEAIQLGLDYDAECTMWSQGVFGLSAGTLETLCRAVKDFEFAILVLTPDDLVHKRGTARNSPRDNVVFELGLFMGALGRERTYIVRCRDEAIDLPTDLAGITVADYGRRSDGNLHAALGSVCTRIKTAIRTVGREAANQSRSADAEVITGLSTEIASLKSELVAQKESVRRMFESLMSGRTLLKEIGQQVAAGDGGGLAFLEGAWARDDPDGGASSWAYSRMIGNELKFVYCYGGNHRATGEYFDMRLVEGSLIGRFRWFDGSFEGYVYFNVVEKNRLEGGWWLSTDVPGHMVERIPDVRGMVSSVWVRQAKASIAPLPRWADGYFQKLKSLPTGRRPTT